jgi:hypothetical protein
MEAIFVLQAAIIQPIQQLTPHARLPEFLKMRGDTIHGLLMVGHSHKKLTNSIGHLYQMLHVHRANSLTKPGVSDGINPSKMGVNHRAFMANKAGQRQPSLIGHAHGQGCGC